MLGGLAEGFYCVRIRGILIPNDYFGRVKTNELGGVQVAEKQRLRACDQHGRGHCFLSKKTLKNLLIKLFVHVMDEID